MSLDFTSNADDVASDLTADLVLDAASRANQKAADEALRLVDPQTPRRSGRLAAGNRVVAAPDGWSLVNETPYAPTVDARTGFASRTLTANEEALVAVYDTEFQATFDTL